MLNLNIVELDHVVYNVADAERSVAFYSEKLGLEPLRLDAYREGRIPFPSVRLSSRTIVDFFPPEYHRTQPSGSNVNHIALTCANSAHEIAALLRERGVEIVREMMGNFGAQGENAHSFHVIDPDGNLLELQAYED